MNTATASTSTVFKARGLTKLYGQGGTAVQAMHGLDLDIVRSEFVVLRVSSGNEKSTLFNIRGVQDTATAGSPCWTHGGQMHELIGAGNAEQKRDRRAPVGFVLKFYNLIPSLTARENVALVTDLAVAPMQPEDALALVGLGGRLNHCVSQTSQIARLGRDR